MKNVVYQYGIFIDFLDHWWCTTRNTSTSMNIIVPHYYSSKYPLRDIFASRVSENQYCPHQIAGRILTIKLRIPMFYQHVVVSPPLKSGHIVFVSVDDRRFSVVAVGAPSYS
jgi:hypothetical protein